MRADNQKEIYAKDQERHALMILFIPALALAATDGSQPHNNLMPYQTFTYCIALQGIYPPRS